MNENKTSRRQFIEVTGLGAIAISGLGGVIECAEPEGRTKKEETARIRLRPYHPTYVIGRFSPSYRWNKKNPRYEGFKGVHEKIRTHPDIKVELVEQFDDICIKCELRVEDEKGSIWGKDHSCPSARNPDTVKMVNRANKRVLSALGLKIGSVIAFKELVTLLAEKLPVLDVPGLGNQKRYEEGLAVLASFLQTKPPAG